MINIVDDIGFEIVIIIDDGIRYTIECDRAFL